MIIQTKDVHGFAPAICGMRNPMESYDKSDSRWLHHDNDSKLMYEIGEKDKELSIRLQKAGSEHCKHLRMIYVWADITAARYWWTEMDTYRAGVEKVSCSTMHKLMARPLTTDDFEHDAYPNIDLWQTIARINAAMDDYKDTEDAEIKKKIWRGIIQSLPQSYLQKRTICMSYAALRNIVRQREGHKLNEWKYFIDWAHTLPNAWMIFD
jgi:hypothetical protein